MSLGNNHPTSGSFAPVNKSNWKNARYPLGAHADGCNITFSIYSKHATRILLEIYQSPTGEGAKYDYWLTKNPKDNIWRAKIKKLPAGSYYAFRCWGPNWPFDSKWSRGNSGEGFICDVDENGNRFNPNKVVFDPYTRELSHDKETPQMVENGYTGEMYGTGDSDYQGIPRRNFDTGPWIPKGIVLQKGDRLFGEKPLNPPENAVIYEAHVRGLTQHHSASRLTQILDGIPGFESVPNVPEIYRGTYKGAGYMAKYLAALGYTAIELLPVHETENDINSNHSPLGNYWGYMTFGFFAPDRRYAYDKSPGGPTREFQDMVKAFHDEGIEVYLDVVFNHTGEGGNWGDHNVTGFVSFGGFDAAEYYHLSEGNDLVSGATGVGNQLNFSRSVNQNMVLDSLTYWLEEMGVDGFRFDLAPVLGRLPDNHQPNDWDAQKQFYQNHPLLKRIDELGKAHNAEMIAEAWDIWGYHVGEFPDGWAEWNGRYRDSIRRFMKGDGNNDGFVRMLNGDYKHFNDQGGPHRSVNFIVAHDGFNLMDLVSYNQKNNNTPWPFGPSDGGASNNMSWDSGGDHALRRQRLRNFWTVQFFSRGIPMTVWGDEFGRTQNGNNNPYNIDSVATWNNYNMIATNTPTAIDTGYGGNYHDNFGQAANEDKTNPMFAFCRFINNIRKQHPALRQSRYADFLVDKGQDVTYQFRKHDGQSYLQSDDKCIWLRIDGSEINDVDFLLLINMFHEKVDFNVPDQAGKKWVRIVDTASWAETQKNTWDENNAAEIKYNYGVNPFSVVVLREKVMVTCE